ncbi:MAG: cyclic pyranopterin monophosphate synthase MoaC [Chloroflexi bacterium]|nr:cyclic pyranopterin monophosphate synthase MoaC [Chloroflexota bacterium]
MPELTHFDSSGRARMVNVSNKAETERVAIARGIVRMQPDTLELIKQGKMSKGDVLGVAQVAGIMAAKQTPHLIPMCHPILIDEVSLQFEIIEPNKIEITATVKCTGKTGVEMEAMTAVSVAALTIYDMCKSAEKGIKIDNIRLVQKSGGKSGTVILE